MIAFLLPNVNTDRVLCSKKQKVPPVSRKIEKYSIKRKELFTKPRQKKGRLSSDKRPHNYLFIDKYTNIC